MTIQSRCFLGFATAGRTVVKTDINNRLCFVPCTVLSPLTKTPLPTHHCTSYLDYILLLRHLGCIAFTHSYNFFFVNILKAISQCPERKWCVGADYQASLGGSINLTLIILPSALTSTIKMLCQI